MVFSYEPAYACFHLFDAAYVCKGSYVEAYVALTQMYGRKMAIEGYMEHRRRRSVLVRYDWLD